MEKIKSLLDSQRGKNILMVCLLVLVGLGGFGLGRLSSQSKSGLEIKYPDLPVLKLESSAIKNSNNIRDSQIKTKAKTVSVNTSSSINFLASKKGSKYYPVRCSAGKSIKLDNRVYFTTEQEAMDAGYSKSSSCK